MSKERCPWCLSTPLYRQYHDQEWGVPCYDAQQLFEFLILEGAQAGLSWITILNKRENYRQAFDQFNPAKIARYSNKKIECLLENPGIIRNRLKINSTIDNAKHFLRLQEAGQDFSDYLWQFVDGKPICNHWQSLQQVPTSTDVAKKMSQSLKKEGFRFVGETICYAFMQATGMVNDHLISCFRHHQIAKHHPDYRQ